jgi:hypothetical protein
MDMAGQGASGSDIAAPDGAHPPCETISHEDFASLTDRLRIHDQDIPGSSTSRTNDITESINGLFMTCTRVPMLDMTNLGTLGQVPMQDIYASSHPTPNQLVGHNQSVDFL